MQTAGIDKPGMTPHKLRHSFACMSRGTERI
jgi:integrase